MRSLLAYLQCTRPSCFISQVTEFPKPLKYILKKESLGVERKSVSLLMGRSEHCLQELEQGDVVHH